MAVAVAITGTVASVVTSPVPRSSARASCTARRISSFERAATASSLMDAPRRMKKKVGRRRAASTSWDAAHGAAASPHPPFPQPSLPEETGQCPRPSRRRLRSARTSHQAAQDAAAVVILTVSGGLVLTVSYPRAIFNETTRRHWPRKSKNLASSRGDFQTGDDALRERLAHPWNFTSHRPHNYHALLPQIPGRSGAPGRRGRKEELTAARRVERLGAQPEPSPGVEIRKAIITAAGKSQRTLPLQTLVDRDGVQKTALAALIEEVLLAGVEQVCVVIWPGDQSAYAAAAGTHAARIQFVEQASPLGYGHAIHCAKAFAGNQPFLLLVGDHLYVSGNQKRCAQQLVEVAAGENCAVSAVQATHESKLPYYGAIGGRLVPGKQRLYEVQDVLEKPTPTEAEQRLIVPGLRAGHYLCFFGMHVLTPMFMEILADEVARAGKMG